MQSQTDSDPMTILPTENLNNVPLASPPKKSTKLYLITGGLILMLLVTVGFVNANQKKSTQSNPATANEQTTLDLSNLKILGINDKNQLLVKQGDKYYLVDNNGPATGKSYAPIELSQINQDDFTPFVLSTPTVTPEAEVTSIPTITPTTKPTSTPQPTLAPLLAKIELTGSVVDNGVSLKWSVNGMDSNLGFKIVRSKEANPVYPGNDYKYLSEPSVRQYVWPSKDGQTYHYRVCKYTGDGCGTYSNEIVLQSPSGESSSSNESVSSITIKSESGNKVSWTLNGTSDMGFKLVWSKNSSPTYPLRSGDKYQYYSNPTTKEGTLSAFDGSGTYHVRVCEYLGGKCGVYSNEIEVAL